MDPTRLYVRPSALRSGCLAAIACLMLSPPLDAASHLDDGTVFELDANAVAESGADDWESVIPPDMGNALIRTFVTDRVNDGTDENFTQGGSKDERDVSAAGITGQFWRHASATPPDKDDIGHAFAAAYLLSNGSVDEAVIYFGADRFANDGDAALGFWFFKSPVSKNSNGTFSGAHTVGDILVTTAFTGGGSKPEIHIWRWNGNAKSPLTLLVDSAGSAPLAPGEVYCSPNGVACGTTNLEAVDVPANWPSGFTFKGAGLVDQFPPGTLFEGAINLTQLAGSDGTCFSSFLAMTRTSTSTTAQLKDFALGVFPLCGIEVAKACALEQGNPSITSDGSSIHTRFSVPVRNTGAGPVHDVVIEEDIELGNGTDCEVASIDGTPTSMPLSQNVATSVAAVLAAGTTLDVVVACDHTANPLVNTLTARAKSSSLASIHDLEASYRTGDGGADELCSPPVVPGITVTKSCDSVTLVAGTVQPRVCVDITVTNSGDEALEDVLVVDDQLSSPLLSGGSLAPGEVASFLAQCYEPTAPDGNETDPGMATFTDRATASASGVISGNPAEDSKTATCSLCPGPICPAN